MDLSTMAYDPERLRETVNRLDRMLDFPKRIDGEDLAWLERVQLKGTALSQLEQERFDALFRSWLRM